MRILSLRADDPGINWLHSQDESMWIAPDLAASELAAGTVLLDHRKSSQAGAAGGERHALN